MLFFPSEGIATFAFLTIEKQQVSNSAVRSGLTSFPLEKKKNTVIIPYPRSVSYQPDDPVYIGVSDLWCEHTLTMSRHACL